MNRSRKLAIILVAAAFMLPVLFSAAWAQGSAADSPFGDGMKLYYQKRFADSQGLFQEAFEKNPQDAMALSFFLSAKYRTNELIQSVNFLEKRAMEGGETPLLKAHLAIGYFTRGLIDANMMEEAHAQLKEALTKEPDLPVANTVMGMIYYQKRLIPRAKGYFIKALKGNPKDLMALERLGEIMMVDDKNPASAMDFFNQIIAIAPDYSDGYFYAASAQQRQGNKDEAVRLFQKCIETDPLGVLKGYDAPVRIGDIYLEDKRWEEAEKYYKSSLAIDPANSYAQTQLKKAKARGQKWEGEKVSPLKEKLETP